MELNITFAPDIVKPYSMPIRIEKGNACRYKIIRINLENEQDIPDGLDLQVIPPDAVKGMPLSGSTITIPPTSQGFTIYALYKYENKVSEEINTTITANVSISCGEDGSSINETFNLNVRIRPNRNTNNNQQQVSGASTFDSFNTVSDFGTIVEAEFVEEVEALYYRAEETSIQLPNLVVRIDQNLRCPYPVYVIPKNNSVFKLKEVGAREFINGLWNYTFSVRYLGGGVAGENNIKLVASAISCGSDEEINKKILILNQNQIQSAMYSGTAMSNNNDIVNEALNNGINLDNVSSSESSTNINLRIEIIQIARELYNDPDKEMTLEEVLDALPFLNDYENIVQLCFPNDTAQVLDEYANNPTTTTISYSQLLSNYNVTHEEMQGLINDFENGNTGGGTGTGGGAGTGSGATLDDLSTAITKIAEIFNTPELLNPDGTIDAGGIITETSETVSLQMIRIIFGDESIQLGTLLTENMFLLALSINTQTLQLLADNARQTKDANLIKAIEALLSTENPDLGARIDFIRVISATGVGAGELSNAINIDIQTLENKGISISDIAEANEMTEQEVVDKRDEPIEEPAPPNTLIPTETEEVLNENKIEITGTDLNDKPIREDAPFVDQVFNPVLNNNIINLDNVVGFTFEDFDSLIIREVIEPEIELGYLNWNTEPGDFVLGVDKGSNTFLITARVLRRNCDADITIDSAMLNRNSNFEVTLLPNIIKRKDVQTFIFEVKYHPDNQPNNNTMRFVFRSDCGVIDEAFPIELLTLERPVERPNMSVTHIGNQYAVYDKPILLDLNPLGQRRHTMRVKIDEMDFESCLATPSFRIGKRLFNMNRNIEVGINGNTEDSIVTLENGQSDASITVEYKGSLEKNASRGYGGNINLQFDAQCPPLRNYSAIDSYVDFPNPVQVRIINSSLPDTQPGYLIDDIYLKENYNFTDSQDFEVIVNFKLIGNFNSPVIMESPNAEDFNVSLNQNNVIVPSEGNNTIKMRYNGGITNRTRGYMQLKFNAGSNGGIKSRVLYLRINDTTDEFTIDN